MDYLRVRNWDEFQQYKDRDPKWIKLHRDLLDDYEFDQLDEVSQIHLVKIWLLAAKLDNKIPNDPKWLTRKIGAKSKIKLNQLVTYGFLVPYKSVQECTETYLETETETETETEAEREAEGECEREKRKARISADWKLTDHLREYCKTKRPDLDPDDTAEGFHNFWLADGRTKLDWDRAFMTWVRNEKPRKRNPVREREERNRRAFEEAGGGHVEF